MRCKKKSKEVLWLLKPAFRVTNDKNPSFKHEKTAKSLDYVILLHYLFFLSFFFFFKISSMTCEFMKIHLQRVETMAVQIWPPLSSNGCVGRLQGIGSETKQFSVREENLPEKEKSHSVAWF